MFGVSRLLPKVDLQSLCRKYPAKYIVCQIDKLPLQTEGLMTVDANHGKLLFLESLTLENSVYRSCLFLLTLPLCYLSALEQEHDVFLCLTIPTWPGPRDKDFSVL